MNTKLPALFWVALYLGFWSVIIVWILSLAKDMDHWWEFIGFWS